ncbi:L-threonylcarbamoyladenylate synthase [Salegentibacter sp. F188]|uniref:Threonylcarbamoyl-AMP synthase n=1 Tax=Autumnicola patrickiae TaxID=3075591 RepID=A0ABU3DYP6_9FLAO|nr:L-threonylcarbamoyladenylate synthase [Salegentibacter sp. F188]MDT0688795.1 L-threonylcarbamoyladenylate synthase [Salegentibacter sp. F188]
MQTNIEKAILELNNTGIVAIPTETVYGLAGNAFSENAVKKIFRLKKRPAHNPLIVHLSSADDLEKIAKEIPETAFKLARSFWPGPLTLVLKKKNIIPGVVTSGLETVAVRVPNHPLTLELLQRLQFPLAAPSANPFGSISPTKAAHVKKYFKGRLSTVLDGGECERGIESTIVGFNGEEPIILRHGAISIEELEKVVGSLKFSTHNEDKPNAPGMLSRHYSPATESYLTTDVIKAMTSFPGKRIGLLLFSKRVPDHTLIHQEVLSETGNFKEAANKLYAAMHRLDKKNADVLIFEELPEKGLGLTINDKLRRATNRKI